MRKICFILISIMLVVPSMDIYAGTECESHKIDSSDTSKLRVAHYSVPDITKAEVMELAKLFSNEKAIQTAKPDLEKNELYVTYDSSILKGELIQKMIREVKENVKLLKIGAADANHSKAGCGKCPHKKTCASAKKD